VLTVIQHWRKKSGTRLLAGFMALFLFDMSVDFQYASSVEQNLSINEIESLSELVLEEIADFENLFEETTESDREPITKTALSLVYVLPMQFSLKPSTPTTPVSNKTGYSFIQYSVQISKTTPPPRQA